MKDDFERGGGEAVNIAHGLGLVCPCGCGGVLMCNKAAKSWQALANAKDAERLDRLFSKPIEAGKDR